MSIYRNETQAKKIKIYEESNQLLISPLNYIFFYLEFNHSQKEVCQGSKFQVLGQLSSLSPIFAQVLWEGNYL